MEVVVLLVALVGIALVVIPRLQRRRAGARRPSAAKPRKSAVKRGRSRVPAAAAGMTSTTRLAPAASDVDGWDDDLGWEGVESTAPQSREAWENWRATDSPLAVRTETDAAAAPEPELPSVDRWRAKAEESEWEEDDDGLGWEGERAPSSPTPEPTAWSSAGDSSSAPVGGGALGRDWSRAADAPARQADSAPAFAAAASAATDVAPTPSQEVVRTIALEDDDWDPPVSQTWGAREDAPAKRSAPGGSRKPRKNKLHPVVLVAIYAAAGIGLVVLASTALLGGSTDPAPAAIEATPTPSATPEITSVPTVDAAATEAAAAKAAAAKKAAAATAAAERKARTAFARERTKAARSHRSKVADARAAARRKAQKARERKAPAETTPPSATTPPAATPVPTYVAPTQPAPSYQAPATKRRSVCEFCIG